MSLFKRQKWELVDEGVDMVRVYPMTGQRGTVVCDVYRKMRHNGMYKYKYVPRF